MIYSIKLNYSLDSKITGIKDGLCQAILIENKINDEWKNNFLIPKYGWPNLKEKNINTINQDLNFELKTKAKLTDLIVISPYIYNAEYLVSKKLMQVLIKRNLNLPIFKKVNLLHKEIEINEYYLFQSRSIKLDEIDWLASSFYDPLDYLFGKREKINFNNHEEYINYKKENIPLKINEIALLNNKNYDFIIIDDMDTFISNELLYDLKKHNISNIELP